jgi:hypothetical protein
LAWRVLYDRFGVAEVLRDGEAVGRGGYYLVIEEEIPAVFASEAVVGTSMRAKRARGTLDLDRSSLASPAPGPITLRLNSKDVVDVDVQIYLPEQRVLDFICTDPASIERLLGPKPLLRWTGRLIDR